MRWWVAEWLRSSTMVQSDPVPVLAHSHSLGALGAVNCQICDHCCHGSLDLVPGMLLLLL